MIEKPDSLIVTSFTPEQFKFWFSRENLMHAPAYHLLRLIKPRSGPGGNCFLLVPLKQDPVQRFKYVLWNVEQVPTDPRKSALAGCHYFIKNEEVFYLSASSFEEITASLAKEEFYDVLEFPQPDDYHNELLHKFIHRQ